MNATAGVIDNNMLVHNPISGINLPDQVCIPFVFPSPRYLEDSECYQIRGGFEAELIETPFLKIMNRPGLQQQIVEDLQRVTLAAFGKDESQREIYAPESVILKNCLLVDFLTIVRKGSKIVAYATSSFIGEEILYENASMVNPEYQGSVGLGMIPPMYVWMKIFRRKPELKGTLKIAGRTCNQGVVSMLDHVLENMVVSGQPNLNVDSNELFEKISEKLSCNYDLQTGIVKKVYPAGLPKGGDTIKFGKIFAKLGPSDGYLLTGKVNYMKVFRLLKRETTSIIGYQYHELKMFA